LFNLFSDIFIPLSNTNGHARQTTTEGTVPEAACAIKAFDFPDDGPIGPKHVEIDKKPRL
jgi:hypothetical protein